MRGACHTFIDIFVRIGCNCDELFCRRLFFIVESVSFNVRLTCQQQQNLH